MDPKAVEKSKIKLDMFLVVSKSGETYYNFISYAKLLKIQVQK